MQDSGEPTDDDIADAVSLEAGEHLVGPELDHALSPAAAGPRVVG